MGATIRPLLHRLFVHPQAGIGANIRPTSLGSYVFSASARNLGSRCGCLKRLSSPDRPVDQQPQHSDEKPRSSRAPMTIAESQTPVPWFIRTLLLPHALCETTRTSAETKAHTPEFGHRRQKAHNRFISKNNQCLTFAKSVNLIFSYAVTFQKGRAADESLRTQNWNKQTNNQSSQTLNDT